MEIFPILAGTLLGALLCGLVLAPRLKGIANKVRSESLTEIAVLKVRLEEEKKAALEKLILVQDAEKKLTDTFQALSAQALQRNNQSFLELAKTNLEKFQQSAKEDLTGRQTAIGELVKPLKDSLEKVDGKIQDLEKQRVSAYATLTEQIKFLSGTQEKLQFETSNLVKALRAPQVRGRWGEMTLKRVAELSGMVEHCDFTEQESRDVLDGRVRPDMIVKLPLGKQIVVDAKTPLQAYLNTLEAKSDEDYEFQLSEHARQMQDHMKSLAHKSYWEQFHPAPEFVVMFVPGENFFSAALKKTPNLIEDGVRQGVILATPTTLISLLKSVGYGWRQERLAENAEEISKLARDLYERLAVLGSHFDTLGRSLKKSVESYNNAVGALEARVLPQARRFQELGVSGKEGIKRIEVLDTVPRALQAPELLGEIDSSIDKEDLL